MDRLKFRVFREIYDDGEPTGKYFQDSIGDYIIYEEGLLGENSEGGGMTVETPERYIIQQCTGLKDKNGKLIYEGDIIRFKNLLGEEFVKEIRRDEDYANWYCDKYDMYDFILAGKIIGNIFENPELLKESK